MLDLSKIKKLFFYAVMVSILISIVWFGLFALDRFDRLKKSPFSKNIFGYNVSVSYNSTSLVGNIAWINNFDVTGELISSFDGRIAGVLSGDNGLVIVNQNNESLIYKIKSKNPELKNASIEIKAVIGKTLFSYLIAISAEGCSRAALVSVKTHRIATQFPCIANDFDSNMVGGGFVENEDGTLYLALGDPARQWAKDGWKSFDNSLSQNPESPYGKVLRVSNWADFDSETVLDLKIFASGLRNPQGMTSTSNGDIFFTDHGASGGDELNILIEGKDYGWPLVSMGKTYTGVKFPNSYSAKTSPIYSWIPSIAPSDLVSCPRILSDRYKGLTCTIVSSLRGESLFVILTSGMQAQAQLRSVQELEIGTRIREVQASDSNSIEIFTDNGEHYKLTFSPI